MGYVFEIWVVVLGNVLDPLLVVLEDIALDHQGYKTIRDRVVLVKKGLRGEERRRTVREIGRRRENWMSFIGIFPEN